MPAPYTLVERNMPLPAHKTLPEDLHPETLQQTTTPLSPSRPIVRAGLLARQVADLVSGERERTHGDKVQNHQNIADLWMAYLGTRVAVITARDVALMMALLKIARTKLGAYNPDDYADLVGYGAVAAEIASFERS